MPEPKARPHLHALTGLRFFAALHVVGFHLWRFDAWDAPVVVERFVRSGPVAVTLFFVLSGFVLTYTYADGTRLVTTTRSFLWARFARVYPVYLLGLLLSFPVVLALWSRAGGGAEALTSELARGLAAGLLVQAHHPDLALAWNPPAWSLSAEAFFYVLFPLLAPRVLACSRRSALVVGGVAVGVSLLASYGLALAADAATDDRVQRLFVHAFKYHPLVRLPEFLLGVVAARLFLDERGPPRVPATAWLVALASLVVVALGLVPYALWHNAFLAPLFALVVVALASGPTTVGRALSCRALVKLGEASYALYILHVPLLYWIAGVGERRTGEKVLERPAVALVSLVVIVALSRLVFVAVEAPLRRWLRRAGERAAPPFP